jgi:ABC-type glycerol-3-phosphate transport system substrate-binding protein
VEPFAVYYNKSLFRQRGLADPWERAQLRGDWTLEELAEAARQLNDPANDVWGLDWGFTDYHGIGPPIWTRGVSHLQYDPQMAFRLQLPEVQPGASWTAGVQAREQGDPGWKAQGAAALAHWAVAVESLPPADREALLAAADPRRGPDRPDEWAPLRRLVE